MAKTLIWSAVFAAIGFCATWFFWHYDLEPWIGPALVVAVMTFVISLTCPAWNRR